MLKLSASDHHAIRRHGEETYPHECCGILLGTMKGDAHAVGYVIRCDNACTESPQSRYRIHPRDLARAQREARAKGLDIVGFYHSHPDHPARCSPTDLEEAYWIGCSYVIISVENGNATTTASFALTGSDEEDRALTEEAIDVEDSR